ncbi:hypothetical protein Poli38472_008828 [Pythium oligandrum]|uniref:Enhancer of polycomb-like protein n=1 Tax=Pythium oligandrum TaxID=41045 RepID=A0A8K1C4D3_PYTOL|nr:hypothetical protein Poli38472_008828 [Pythium oligandrum]|eukprot:TMW56180.1 hypothetical protein Poli38472_008828 [Pythium oligandrum]
MRRQSLRPRQIDVHARMRIIRSQEDLVMDEDASGTQPSTTFEELVAHLDDPQQPVTQKLRRKKNIPIPVTLNVESYVDEVKDDFSVPTSYVRFQNVPSASEDNKVELDIELAEMKWLKYHPKYGDNGDPRYQITLVTLAKMLDCLEKASAMIVPNVISLAEAEEVFAKQLGMVKTPLNRVTVDVYNYWAQKRQALKRPLLRKFWPQTPLNDTNPHLVFRPREKERYKLRKHRKNDMEGYRKLQQLRGDFEQVRHLLDLVKRRERAKRLQIDFLDEIRRQAVHELTSLSGALRKPEIPVDDENDAKKKKKKKKKLRKDGEDDDGVSVGATTDTEHTNAIGSSDAQKDASASASGVNGALGASASGRTVTQTTKVPTFMDYDTSENFRLQDETDEDLRMPYYPSYPMPSSHLMATVFSQPPKYRCRGRVGRGGRLVIDRIPVRGSRYYSTSERMATPPAFAKSASAPTMSLAAGGATPSTSEALNSGHHAPIFVHETSFRPLARKIDSLTTTRLQEIYSMSDSEDELFESLTTPVYETAASRKAANSSAKIPPRAVKYALDI